MTDLARLSLEIEHHRGHGGLYDGLNAGAIDTGQLRRLTCTTPLPKIIGPDGRERIVLAVDVSNWLRPDAATSPERAFCHTYARGAGQAQMIPRVAVLVCVRPGSRPVLLDRAAGRGADPPRG